MISDMASCKIEVRLVPRASANEIVGMRNGMLLVRVTAPPVDGRANSALCRLLAKRTGVGVREVSVAGGLATRSKVILIHGKSTADVMRALGPLEEK
jgi:uncharacterized protein (TIGR00251 family)